jgi:y4mF family transcriptional regulator
LLLLYANTYNMSELSDFVKTKRKQLGLNQEELAEKSGVALTVIRKIEQGKENLSLAKVNQVLHMFGHVLGSIKENDATRNS